MDEAVSELVLHGGLVCSSGYTADLHSDFVCMIPWEVHILGSTEAGDSPCPRDTDRQT